jgi:hypothetical protein
MTSDSWTRATQNKTQRNSPLSPCILGFQTIRTCGLKNDFSIIINNNLPMEIKNTAGNQKKI